MKDLVMVRLDFGLRDAFGEEIIVLTKEEYQELLNGVGTEIYIGEYEGKHSEVRGDLEARDFKIIDCSDEFKNEFLKLFPNGFGLHIYSCFKIALEEQK